MNNVEITNIAQPHHTLTVRYIVFAGLFPLLAHAALNVKPALLLLYETHFVPLGKHIKPALSGLLLGLLPGLEEGSESFER